MGGGLDSQVNLSLSGREDVPDFLLFADRDARERAYKVPDSARARLGIALMEAKRWLRALDRSEDSATGNRKQRDFGAPSSQMLRYLSRADVLSDRAVKWCMLSNGAIWRLYWQDARARAEDFFEIDLARMFHKPAQPTMPQPMRPNMNAAGRGEDARAALDGGKIVQQRAGAIGRELICCPTGRTWPARAEHCRHPLWCATPLGVVAGV